DPVPDHVPRPPGPSLGPLAPLRLGRRELLDLVARTARDHPRLAYLRLFGESVYVVSRPDLVREVLVVAGRATKKGRGLERAGRLLGEGLLTSEGEVHRRHRALLRPAFHTARIEAYAQVMVEAARAVPWRDGQVVDLPTEMADLTLGVVGRTLFGADLSGEADEVRDALTEFLETFERVMSPSAGLLLRLPSRLRRRIDGAQRRLERVVGRLLADRRRRPGGDLLSLLLSSGLSEAEIRDEVLTFVLAGHGATANALAWAWWLLDRSPAAAGSLHAEVDALPAAPSYDDLRWLAVTRAVVAETLRLYPPAYAVGRRATRDLELDGWRVPAGALLVVSQWVTHRDPRWWGEDAEQFRPGRWLDGEGRFGDTAPGRPRLAYFPFGAGSRVCIGESFAWTETVLLLATLARSWTPAVAPGWVADVRPAITLRPAGGIPAVLHTRGGATRSRGRRGELSSSA
ncbi:MAG TPA: cytochrome P450, partial [Frankiaceae bacterium]|nr:cytochrome P450 [Frankiaceae bacterium]